MVNKNTQFALAILKMLNRKYLTKILCYLYSVLIVIILSAQKTEYSNPVRLKDLVNIKNAEENQLKGVGLVIGLQGTGDSSRSLTREVLATVLSRSVNLKISPENISSKNVALVMVTATIGPFQDTGTWIDVSVSSIGDAKSLKGGILVATPLHGPGPIDADQTVYAIAQGSIITSDTHLTTGFIPRGAKVEKLIPQNFIIKTIPQKNDNKNIPSQLFKTEISKKVYLTLRDPDFNLANSITSYINGKLIEINYYVEKLAKTIDAGTIELDFGNEEDSRIVYYLSKILELEIILTNSSFPTAMVVINEKNQSYAVTGEVYVLPVRVRTANVTLDIPEILKVKDRRQKRNAVIPLKDVLEVLEKTATPVKDIINILKDLNSARAIKGKVIIQ
ncbi:MAG: flagellar basal body P-ring protein FlgI [Planctomycetota bacterium]